VAAAGGLVAVAVMCVVDFVLLLVDAVAPAAAAAAKPAAVDARFAVAGIGAEGMHALGEVEM